MIKAAGILFLVGDTTLYLRRGNGSAAPNMWCCPGGKIEDGETAAQAAIRETLEEAGIAVTEDQLIPWTRTVMPAIAGTDTAIEGQPIATPDNVDFTAFLVKLPEQFTPTLAVDEHDGYAWAPIGAPPQPIHPGMQIALDRLTMDELGVARAMADGRLASPQFYENMWMFNIRITGTGASYRTALEEFVWRDPSLYLNDEFLARCNGLQVIWEHPEKAVLDSDEFESRTIGSVFLPYIKGDEVWAVAKIYDADAADALINERLSTSPSVKLLTSDSDRVTLENGKVMLIEGKPHLLDHIAICERGVWDKLGDPNGVESVSVDDNAQDEVLSDKQEGNNHNGIVQTPSLNLIRAQAALLLAKARLCVTSN